MTRPARHPRTALCVALTASASLLLGCSAGSPETAPPGDSDDGAASAEEQSTEPAAPEGGDGAGTAPLVPAEDPPPDSRVLEWEGASIAVPDAWTQEEAPDPDPRLFVVPPDDSQAGLVLMAGDRQGEDTATAVDNLERQLQADGWEHTVHRDLEWPGATEAALVRFIDDESAEVDFETWQLVLDTQDGRTLSLLGFAPARDFASTGISDAMATYRPAG